MKLVMLILLLQLHDILTTAKSSDSPAANILPDWSGNILGSSFVSYIGTGTAYLFRTPVDPNHSSSRLLSVMIIECE